MKLPASMHERAVKRRRHLTRVLRREATQTRLWIKSKFGRIFAQDNQFASTLIDELYKPPVEELDWLPEIQPNNFQFG
ncbi:hypothetical protein BN2476_300129 [Paraburkholderia piptadeniae]|uniref:Uncharacterized protein n=1 Tax=Paraburkholderia piptadeniae TaxID=1701573 RepID=A0A1N7S318_9BURK|nr:hypothetical protein BN2476_300129 [Paraburkholderia piptadeniae]